MSKPFRYRDVLAMLKGMARDERITSDALRALIGGNLAEGPESYTQADIQRTRELAHALGWELPAGFPDEAERVEFGTPAEYQSEIRRLYAAIRLLRTENKFMRSSLKLTQERTNAVSIKRQEQIKQAGVASVDEAFARLRLFQEYIESDGAIGAEAVNAIAPSRAASLTSSE